MRVQFVRNAWNRNFTNCAITNPHNRLSSRAILKVVDLEEVCWNNKKPTTSCITLQLIVCTSLCKAVKGRTYIFATHCCLGDFVCISPLSLSLSLFLSVRFCTVMRVSVIVLDEEKVWRWWTNSPVSVHGPGPIKVKWSSCEWCMLMTFCGRALYFTRSGWEMSVCVCVKVWFVTGEQQAKKTSNHFRLLCATFALRCWRTGNGYVPRGRHREISTHQKKVTSAFHEQKSDTTSRLGGGILGSAFNDRAGSSGSYLGCWCNYEDNNCWYGCGTNCTTGWWSLKNRPCPKFLVFSRAFVVGFSWFKEMTCFIIITLCLQLIYLCWIAILLFLFCLFCLYIRLCVFYCSFVFNRTMYLVKYFWNFCHQIILSLLVYFYF